MYLDHKIATIFKAFVDCLNEVTKEKIGIETRQPPPSILWLLKMGKKVYDRTQLPQILCFQGKIKKSAFCRNVSTPHWVKVILNVNKGLVQ